MKKMFTFFTYYTQDIHYNLEMAYINTMESSEIYSEII